MARVVTLYGTIERELQNTLLFRVSAGMGDAGPLGFVDRSSFWIARKQCVEVKEARLKGDLDVLKMGYEVASLKLRTCVFPGED